MNSKEFIISYHLPGILNLIADWLSVEGTFCLDNRKSKQHLIAHNCPFNNVVTYKIMLSFPQLVSVIFKTTTIEDKNQALLV